MAQALHAIVRQPKALTIESLARGVKALRSNHKSMSMILTRVLSIGAVLHESGHVLG